MPARVAGVPERTDEQEERDDRPEHDHPGGEQPDGRVHRPEVAAERRVAVSAWPGNDHQGASTAQNTDAKGTPRRAARPRRGRRRRARRAGRRGAYATAPASANATPAVDSDVPAAEDVDDQRQPGQRQRERDPDPPAHGVVVDEARPERDEQRREVLDQQRDPDREAMDREEVEPLHEREPADAEHERDTAARAASGAAGRAR